MFPTVQASAQLAEIEHRFVTVEELAARLSRNVFTVYHQLKRAPERLPRVSRLYGRVLFAEVDVRAYIDAVRAGATPCPTCGHCTALAGIADPGIAAGGKTRGRGRPTKAQEIAARQALNATSSLHLSMAEVAALVGMSKQTIRRRLRDHLFPSPIKEGGHVYWLRNVIDEYLAKREAAGDAALAELRPLEVA